MNTMELGDVQPIIDGGDKVNSTAEDNKVPLIPREYQIEILEKAKKGNTVACLGTGTGKTFIAVLLIKENAHHVQIPFQEGGKRIFFLVPTVPLVVQQEKVIADQTELTVKGYYGEMNIDMWSCEKWAEEFEEHQVLVMTGEICRIILHHNFLSVSRICLLILDECHQAKGKSPYSEVMKYIDKETVQPLIFGLSASLINNKCKPHHFDKELSELKRTLLSDITTATDYQDVLKYGTDAKEYVVLYNESESPCEFSDIISRMKSMYDKIRETERRRKEEKKLDPEVEELLDMNSLAPRSYLEIIESGSPKPEQYISQVIKILEVIGPWCAYHAAELLCEELQNSAIRATEDNQVPLTEVNDILREFVQISKCHGMDSFSKTMTVVPSKLQRLMAVFEALNTWCLKIQQLEEIEQEKNLKCVSFRENPEIYIENTRSNNFFQLCGIIFVKERVMAYTLCKWINELSKRYSQFNFIKSEYIIGQGYLQRDLTNEKFYMSAKKQKEIVERFKKKEFNVLVATSVLEEGLDVQKCNFVLRFDFPDNFKSFIQSKGRARAKKSLYVIFMNTANTSQQYLDLINYKSIELMLIKNCFNKEMDSDEEDTRQLDVVQPYEKMSESGRSIITASAAVGLLHRYCAKLPSDVSVHLKPHFLFEIADPDAEIKEYICTVLLPINCAVHEPIKSRKTKSKSDAKRIAALEACKRLDEVGELDDHLLPKSNDEFIEFAAEELGVLPEELETFGEGKPGSSKRRQLYKKAVAEVFKNNIPTKGVPCYLYVFEMDLTVPLPRCLNPRNRPIINPADSSEGFGLLSTVKLPKVCKFPLFTKCGKILVDIQLTPKQFKFTKTELCKFANFHNFIFKDALWLIKPFIEFLPQSAEFSTYVVPVNKDKNKSYFVDMDIITRSLSHDYMQEKDTNFKEIPRKKFKDHSFENAVVIKSYQRFERFTKRPIFYHISQIRHDMTPLSNIGDNNRTFKNHYKETYHIDIEYDNQPMLDVHRVQILNMARPLYVSVYQVHKEPKEGTLSKSKQEHEKFREYLIPELCIIHPFPDSLFRKATYLPTILFRFNELLIAEQIRVAVAQEMLVGTVSLNKDFQWPAFHLESSDYSLNEYLIKEGHISSQDYHVEKPVDIRKNSGYITSFEVNVNIKEFPGPSPALLLQALTTKQAHDEFNLERLETIGDSFLKYTISVKLFSMYPKFDEGKLTALRIKVIRNLNLYQLMKQKGLSNYLMNLGFYCTSPEFNGKKLQNLPHANWLPPCYVLKNTICNDTKSKETISKNLDDSEKVNTSGEEVKEDSDSTDSSDICEDFTESHDEIMKTIDEDKMDIGYSSESEMCEKMDVDDQNDTKQDKTAEKKAKKKSKHIPKEMYYTHHLTSDKCIADSAEALIGAYLLSCGHNGALYFMHWLGVSPFVIHKSESGEQITDFENWPPIPPSPLRREQSLIQSMNNLLNFDKFEKRIGYKFKQPAFLLQAFTHASYDVSFNDLTDCYQRLEFLGDAILDYLVTRTLYDSPQKHTPGQLTDLRMALVNNAYFASLAVKYGFHKNLKCLSTTLYKLMNRYVDLLESTDSFQHFKEYGYYMEEKECVDVDEIEVPKALGDIVESVAGAIYLDSGSSLDTVWRVYYKMMQPAIDHLCMYVPKSPVRELYELVNKNVFKDIKVQDDKTYVLIVLPDGTEFTGVGPNKKVAKTSAAKKAVLHLKGQKRSNDVVSTNE